MYPKNAASPERIAVGSVVLIADGTVQTSSVVITVRGQGGSEATGGGTTAYGATGMVYYTPTQAETNFTSFVVIASKASCLPVAQTVITTASSVPGNVILASATHTGAVIPTVTTLTNLPAITANWLTSAGIAASAFNGKGDWNIGKTAYSLTATTGLGNQTANITGNVSGSVGSVTGLAASNLDATVSSRATPTNITAGTITTVTNLTNAPTAGDLTATMKTSVTTAATSATPIAASVTGNIGGNVTGSVGSVATGGIAAASLATAAKQDIADFMLDRNMATGTDSGTNSTSVRTPRQALRALRNKASIAAGVVTVTKEDDAATSWTAAVTTTAGDPISGVDPT